MLTILRLNIFFESLEFGGRGVRGHKLGPIAGHRWGLAEKSAE
jgi:hypothetical protein